MGHHHNLYGCKQSSLVYLSGLFILRASLVNGWESLSRNQVSPQWQRLPLFDTSIKLTDNAYLLLREKLTKPCIPLLVDPYGQNPGSLLGVHQLHITDKTIEMGEKSVGSFLLRCLDLWTSVYTLSEMWHVTYFIDFTCISVLNLFNSFHLSSHDSFMLRFIL